MRLHSPLIALLSAALAIVACQLDSGPSAPIATKEAAAPKPDAPAPAFTWLGADISALAGGRGARGGPARGPATYQENGQPDSEIAIMMRHGWNAFRLRVFVSPFRNAPNNSLENTIALAKQIKAAGANFLLDIHYSDTWADPQHQETPLAWRTLDTGALERQVEEYSRDTIAQLKAAGVMPDMVQVGNEITGGTLWPLGHVRVPHSDVKNDAGRIQPLPDPYDDSQQWSNFTRFIKAGIRGVKQGAGDSPVKIVIHIDCGGDWPITQWFFDHFQQAGVDYDIIGQSYYPRYHGTLEGLQQNMIESMRRYHKPTMVVETGYPQSGNLTLPYMIWPASKEGQLQFMADLVNTVKRNHGLGVYYWAPEGRGGGNGMWNADGSPAPSISVLDHLDALTTQPASHLPAPARNP